ncbi:hypothetical protein [Prauserella alba]|uniref:Diacylglycerol kinase catalytic domain-containing protein n=1 Tax=Prauserella alba TaxID=176898 RepID=A0ABP4FTR8_9PSEU|nr:hypothetical protein [Prauserella alba]MCP2183264.1 hypothetical protein [Prauserella alba]
MRGLVLLCGGAELGIHTPEGVEEAKLPSRPGKADVDPLLEPGDQRLVVVGDDADLSAVALRLLRRGRLDDTAVGYVPTDATSQVAGLWGVPADRAKAVDVALSGRPRGVPLVRDDAGGLLLGHGVVRRPRGVGYCDDTEALRGEATLLEVRPDPAAGADTASGGLRVTITRGKLLKRRRTFTGRAFQLGGADVVPESDGVPYPRAMSRWTWYRHTHDFRLVLPPTSV